MKAIQAIVSFLAFLCLCAVARESTPEEIAELNRIEAEEAQLWEKNFQDSLTMGRDEKFDYLKLGLRNMGYRQSFAGHGENIDIIFAKIRNAFLTVPGHAQYFVDQLEKERPLDGVFMPEFDYHRRMYIAQTLVHLPSPETVTVLGRFLYDERDRPPPGYVGQDASPVPSNADLAFVAFTEIGLRNPAITEGDLWTKWVNRGHEALLFTRAWYEEIKSGQRSFSFVGQKVEYRFKPDGTWETIAIENPPDDAPRLSKPKSLAEEPLAKPSLVEGKGSWGWVAGGVLTLIGLLWLAARRSSKPAL